METNNVGRSAGTVCSEIVAQHGDYLDGLLAPHDAARVQWHLSTCDSCARYDRVVRRGIDLVRELPEITPSEDFEQRLQHRIFHVQDGVSLAEPRAAGAAATLAVAGVIALLAWSPLLFPERDGLPVAAATVAEPQRLTNDLPAQRTAYAPSHRPEHLPLTTLPGNAGDMWFPMPGRLPAGTSDVMATLAAFPGPHSPLVVGPPVHGRSVRTVSSQYAPFD